MLEAHAALTNSERASAILDHWETARSKFVKVFPNEYRRALVEIAQKATSTTATQRELV